MTFKSVDLFCGIGGIRFGFERVSVETVFANDMDKHCKTTYDLNFQGTKLSVGDVHDLNGKDMPEFDIITAGFPCQAFSVAGHQRGFKDVRGNAFFGITHLIDTAPKKPLVVFLENVKNLESHDFGKTYKRIVNELSGTIENNDGSKTDRGYLMRSQIINSMDIGGVPQNRERIYVVCFLKPEDIAHDEFAEKVDREFSFPTTPVPRSKVRDMLEPQVDDKYYYEGKDYVCQDNRKLYDRLAEQITDKWIVYQYRRYYVRKNDKGVCPTLTANMGGGGHNVPLIRDDKGIRKLTPRECLRLQAFPDSFMIPKDLTDTQIYKQAGNSVTVSVVEAIAMRIVRAMEVLYG